MSYLGIAVVVAVIGALMWALSDDSRVTTVGWVLFIAGVVAAVVLAVIEYAGRGRRRRGGL